MVLGMLSVYHRKVFLCEADVEARLKKAYLKPMRPLITDLCTHPNESCQQKSIEFQELKIKLDLSWG